MPRSRGSDLQPVRPSARVPLHLRTTASSEANSLHRPSSDRISPKLDDRRSPRSPLLEKKRGTKIADLETKLSQVQEELKKLRDRLASTEAAKLDAEHALENAKEQIPAPALVAEKGDEEEKRKAEEGNANSPAVTDAHQVVVREVDEEDNATAEEEAAAAAAETKKVAEETKETAEEEEELDGLVDSCVTVQTCNEEEEKQEKVEESSEVVELKAALLEKEKEVEFLLEENAIFKRRAKEESEKIVSAARTREQELVAKLSSVEQELKESLAKARHAGSKLEAAEGAKASLEAELKRLKIQTNQWRKAAEAAAAALTSGDRMGMEARCGSVEYRGWGSPLLTAEEMEDDEVVIGGGGGRRKAGGIRMFGDLWKKKGQQK